MKREWFINGSLALGSIACFFLVAEFGLRITKLQTVKPNPPKIYQAHENARISYTLKPSIKERAFRSIVTTDENGFRINALPPTPHPQRPTFITLGDSITFGYGVENNETLSAQLEAQMPDTEFINAGVPGYTLDQEIALYNKEIRSSIDPEGLLLVFYWNDLDRFDPGMVDEDGILRPYGWVDAGPNCDPIQRGLLKFVPGKCWLDINSAFYKALKKLVNMRYNNERLANTREKAKTGEIEDPSKEEHLEEYLEQLTEFSETLPIKKYFVIWPDRYLHADTKPALIKGALKADFTVIDLTEVFGNEAETLSWDTVHPHPDTIKEAARVIEEALE
jgi:hypothetical protein